MIDKQRLCLLCDIADHSAKGFTVVIENTATDIFLVRVGNDIYGYINSCPHTGVSLDWMPDEFMDFTGMLIQCSTHGALFNIEDGYCCYGPCAGDSLSRVGLLVEDGVVFLPPQKSYPGA